MRILLQWGAIFIFILFTYLGNAQTDTLDHKKFSIGAGIGWDYGIIGVTGKYFITENIGFIASIPSPSVGMEVNVPFFSKKDITPFVSIRYGPNYLLRLNDSPPNVFQEPENKAKRRFYGFIYGVGLKYKFYKDKREYFTLSVNYIDRASSINVFIEDFNMQYGTDYSPTVGDFIRPSIGYVFYFR